MNTTSRHTKHQKGALYLLQNQKELIHELFICISKHIKAYFVGIADKKFPLDPKLWHCSCWSLLTLVPDVPLRGRNAWNERKIQKYWYRDRNRRVNINATLRSPLNTSGQAKIALQGEKTPSRSKVMAFFVLILFLGLGVELQKIQKEYESSTTKVYVPCPM